MQPTRKPFVIYNLRETYHEPGRFDFKIVLDPKHFKNGHTSEVTLTNPDLKPMPVDVKTWGRKINCTFQIDDSVPDGVVTVNVRLVDEKGRATAAQAHFWVVK